MFTKYKDLVWSLLLALIAAFLLRAFVFAIYKIPTSSMQPNLLAGDFIISYKLPYGFKIDSLMTEKVAAWDRPKRGEVFVFHLPSNTKVKYIKRVVAVEGDRVEIEGDILIVNGKEATYEELGAFNGSPYLNLKRETLLNMKHKVLYMEKETQSDFGPLTVPPDSVFVLGDNRDSSDDSRYWGVVSLNDIESKVFGIWFSLDIKSKQNRNIFEKVRWNRIFEGIH